MLTRRILIVGGTTRAAADSVRRAGWVPVCADLFADLDLRATAEVIPVQDYPQSLPDDIARVQADAWFYCGALENHPDIIERILVTNPSIGPLLGSSPSALKFVRNPFRLFNCLRWEGMKTLDIADQSSPPKPDGTWLQKPLASAGGRLIRVWDESAAKSPFTEPCYFQRRARGIAVSAIFRFENGKPLWQGASQELDSPSDSSPPSRFSYCGSRTLNCEDQDLQDKTESESGMTLPDSVRQKLIRIAEVLHQQEKGLHGLVGFDFRLDGTDVWLTEINPRYTASVEILELATGRSLLNPEPFESSISADVITPRALQEPGSHSSIVVMKQVLYAVRLMKAPDLSRFLPGNNPWEIPCLADIPVPQIVIEPGWPICTIMSSGKDVSSAEFDMKHRLSQVQEALFRER